jgi:hypothetical protein
LQVPADRLSLAIRVGRQDQFVIGFQRLGDRLYMLAAFGGDLPQHAKTVLGIDRAVLGRQVAHMAIRGQNRIAGTKIFVDCLGLGGRFDDNDWHGFPGK